jgi:NADH:ubiquinone oxidoreductase subunit 5 (subunit L)/multisubunit Na+/H+ antiporter MnhA subunit
VSSLVHRRTLVTAGLFLVFVFGHMVNVILLRRIFLVFGGVTVFFSNILAIFEKDIKKVVALRTMSQIGFCVFSLGLGFIFLTYFHVLRHAFFKSCLFIQVGCMIYFFFSQQDIRGYVFYSGGVLFVQFQFVCCLIRLCGIFFLWGLLRKDFIVEVLFIFRSG